MVCRWRFADGLEGVVQVRASGAPTRTAEEAVTALQVNGLERRGWVPREEEQCSQQQDRTLQRGGQGERVGCWHVHLESRTDRHICRCVVIVVASLVLLS